jgi:hypothetical protein
VAGGHPLRHFKLRFLEKSIDYRVVDRRNVHLKGSVGADHAKHGIYAAGRSVEARDAERLATALEAFVNGPAGDGGDFDLASIVGLVNFLRGGAFAIN